MTRSRSRSRSGLALLMVAFALSAVAATTASAALPEFTGSFPNSFHYTGGAISFTTVGSVTTFRCTRTQGEGSLTSAKGGSIQLRFIGCEDGGTFWTTEGAERGEIKTGTLPIELGYIKREPKQVGLEINHGAGTAFANWTVGGPGHKGGIRGPVIAQLAAINTKTTTYTLTLAKKERGVQNPVNFAGQPRLDLEINMLGGNWEEGALENAGSVVFERETELKA
jgi:hypothetical protein